MQQALGYLGQPDFETDQSDHTDNPLRWWQVELTTAPACDVPPGKTFVVRHARTGPAGHLDVLSEVHFRTTLNLNDNSMVQLRRVPGVWQPGVAAVMCLSLGGYPGSLKAVHSLKGQVDTLYLCLNDFWEVPEELKQDWIDILHFGHDFGDAARFYLLKNMGSVDTHIIACDENIEYPEAYVKDFLAAHKKYPDVVLAYAGERVYTDEDEIKLESCSNLSHQKPEPLYMNIPGSDVSFIPKSVFNRLEFSSPMHSDQIEAHLGANCANLGVPVIGLPANEKYGELLGSRPDSAADPSDRIREIHGIYASYGLELKPSSASVSDALKGKDDAVTAPRESDAESPPLPINSWAWLRPNLRNPRLYLLGNNQHAGDKIRALCKILRPEDCVVHFNRAFWAGEFQDHPNNVLVLRYPGSINPGGEKFHNQGAIHNPQFKAVYFIVPVHPDSPYREPQALKDCKLPKALVRYAPGTLFANISIGSPASPSTGFITWFMNQMLDPVLVGFTSLKELDGTSPADHSSGHEEAYLNAHAARYFGADGNLLSNRPGQLPEQAQALMRAAVREGRLDLLDHLLQSPETDINQPDASGQTALVEAVIRSDQQFEMFEHLLGVEGIDIFQPGFNRFDPLGMAIHRGAVEVIKRLLADPRMTAERRSALPQDFLALVSAPREMHINKRVACLNRLLGEPELAKFLGPARDAEERNALLLTVERPFSPDHYQPDQHGGYEQFIRDTGFAPAEYRPALLEALLACPAIEVTAVDKHGNNALHLAAANKHPRCVEMLLEDGRVDSQSRNAEGLTPLDCAEQVKHKAIIEKLKAHKPADNPPPESLGTLLPRGPAPPDPSDVQSQAWQREFLEWITGEKGGSFDQRCNTLRLLHKKRKWAKLLAPARDADNLTALLRVIEHKGTGLYRPDILRILLSLPEMDLTATDNHGNNALHLAAAQGNARAVTYLLGDGRFDLEARNNAGQTPLECAEQEGHAVVAAQLQARAENLALPRVKPSRPSVPKKEKLTFVTVLTSSGGEYLPEHVERLRQGIARHCSIPHRFFCLSDQPLHCPWIPLTEDWEGWWSKLEIFKHDLGPTVYFDLDTLIVDNLDWMVDAPKQFSMIKDFRETYHNSGVMAWTGDKYRHIADTFKPKEVPYYHARWPGDGGWIREQMPDSATLQKRFPDKIISWKISGWSAPGASVLCFYGTPRPWEVAPPVDVHPGSDCQMISGKIVSGCGSASRIPDELFRARCEAAEAKLTRGTLNIKVGSLKQALDYLGKPDFETDQSSKKLGPLRWWQVELIPEKAPDGTVESGKTFVVRHHRTGTGELEVMSEIHFRTEAGLDNHSAVRIRRLKQEKIKFEMPPGHGSGYVRKHPVFYKLWLKEAGYEYVETMNFPGESMFYFAVNGMRGVIDFHNFADARNKEAPNWDYEDLTVPIFKSHYSRDITYPKNFFPLAPTLCQYGHGRAGMVADLVGLLTDPSFEITPQVGFTCKQEPRGKALHRRNKVRGLLKEHFPDTDLKFNNPPLEFWNMHKTKLAAICVPGLTNNMLDRGQAELMMLGVCTISPYLPEVLLGDVRPEPNVDYLQCADDYSDLIDICKSLTPERAKQIGDNARRKMAALQPKPFWDYVIRTLQDWYHKKPANDAESPPESVSSKAATTNMIRGKLVSGQGKISRLPNAVLQARSKAADAKLVKGSLNVRVDNMKQTLDYLGSPDFVIPQANGNDLRWWQVKLSFESKCEAPPGKTFVVRHTRTGPADYLDVLSETHFRSELNLTDGASVLLRKAHSKDFVGVIATMCMWHPRWPGSMKTVLSLEGQVDTLYLCLNDFSEVPEELKQDWIEILHFGENLGDAPRVYLLRNSGLVNAHVITCDDDIEYPATYVQDFLAAHKEYPNTLLTHHGDVARFKDGEFQRYAWGLRIVGDDHEAKRVCLPGSGVSFIPADIFNQMEFTSLVYFNQLDVHIACNCHKLGIPMIGLSHAKSYIKYTPPPGRTVHKTVTQAHNRIEKVRQIYASYGLNINEIPEEERELEGVRNRPLPSEIQASPEFQPAATRRKIMEQRPELDWEQVEKQCQTVYEMFHQPGPKSLVRAGDGELNLLRRKTSEFLALGIADAMKHADCLGLPDHHQPGRTDHEWKTGLIDALRDDYQTEVDQSPHVSAFLFYVAPELIGYLAAGKRVLWITHGAENIVKNMKNPAFRDYYGLHDIADNYWINTVGRRSGPFPAENEQNVMADIRQKLSEAQDFDLACVGAGAIGKMTCQHIKTALGKTAIDIGGVMSAMQGVRNYTTFRRGGWLNPLVWDPGQVLEAPETNTSNDSITESELEQPASMFTFSSMPDSNYAKVHPTFYKLWLKAAGHEYTEIAKPMGVTKLYFEWNGLAGVICFSDFAVPPHDTNHYKNESDFYKGGKYSHLPLFKAHYSSKHDYPDHVLPFAPTLFGIPGDGRRKALEEFLDFYPSFETAPKEGFTSKQRVSVAATKRRREMHQLLKQHFPDIDLKSNDPPRMFWNAHKTKLAAICIPGATNNMLDRAQMELMMLGVCTISPYLPEVLLGDIRLEPNEDYLQCADDYSDLIDICKSLTPERAKQIGNNARAKLAPLQPKPFWDYVIRTLKEWYETAD